MSYLIVTVIFFTLWHFVYDGVILPSLRLMFRNRLFEIRDRLRMHRIKSGNQTNMSVFDIVHDGINTLINRLPYIDIKSKVEMDREIASNPELLRKVKEGIEMINSCEDEELKNIFRETNIVVRTVLIANSGAWFIYLIPIALVLVSISKLTFMAKELVVLPASTTIKFIPTEKVA